MIILNGDGEFMYRYEDYRNDKDFKLESLSYEEIFNCFKGVVNKIKKEHHDGAFKFCPVELRKDRCEFVMAYGADKDLYPKLNIDMYNYILVLTTFEVKLLEIENGVNEIKSEELDCVLTKMMCEKFPQTNYLEKREEYFANAEIIRNNQYGWQI